MLIKESNRARIEQAIKAAEGRATQRTITYDDIVEAIQHLEKKLGIAKKDMLGTYATIDIHAQNFLRAYKYRAESTIFRISRGAAGWDLTDVERYYTARDGHGYSVHLSPAAEKAILESMQDF